MTVRHLALVTTIALVATACGGEGEPIATGPAVTFATSSTAAPTSGPTTGPATTGPATTPVATEAPTTVPLGDPHSLPPTIFVD